ncbi:MAG TPA: hypothetical protein VEA69_14925 [Tepidisphaeraceae bacterium]|nr:hypothetical protein [Tepidisphaeraceae bacterium]
MEETTGGERAWVESLVPWLSEALAGSRRDGEAVDVAAGYELA